MISSWVIGLAAEPRLCSSTASMDCAIVHDDPDRALEPLRSREGRIDLDLDPVGEPQDRRVAERVRAVGVLAEPARMEGFGERIVHADPGVGVRARAALLGDGLADDRQDVGGDRHDDFLHVARIDRVLARGAAGSRRCRDGSHARPGTA